ncbi:DUF3078 domain-containing protein [Polaribacter batillariae]|uniref:DUF3078 domain-containing protein n=1 Tax=Polaribacter batillariae TaxID=2808900 RepID=A0ABX7SWU8_9FLAO|nr:DUF3078 domain-containing protein [Polaribacter batillariae]QTD38737.1 DUF3078 domain-containing protein [Polaribacter batillariae]
MFHFNSLLKYLFLTFFLIISIAANCQQKKVEKKKAPVPKWKIHGRFTFLFNQSAFSNWAAGGQNTVAGNVSINYDFNYKKNKWNWDSRLITGYGLSYLSGKGYRKTNDRFDFNSLLGLKSSKYWFFSYFTNIKTQYTRGFDYSKTPEVSVSDFLSPAYLSFGPGMLWKKSDNLNINIAPATARLTFVNDMFSGKFGVDEGKNSALSLGFNLASYYKTNVMTNVELENILTVYSDYLDKPQNIDLEYQANLRFKVNKSIKMHITLHTIFDDNASGRFQYRELFGLGVNYSFHEKVTY